METNEVILLKIQVSQEEVEKKILADRAAIVQLRQALVDLNKEYKNKAISAQEFAKSQQSISTQLKAANTSLKEGEKILDEYTKTQAAAEGSLEQMRAQMGLLVPAIAKLSEAERNADFGKELIASASGINAALLELEASYGRHGRNVGNYNGSIKEQNALLSQLREAYDSLSKAEREDAQIGGVVLNQINDLTEAQEKHRKKLEDSRKGVKDYVKEINVLGVNVGSTLDLFKSGSTGIVTFTKSIFSVRGALVALTAIPIVLLLTGIVTLLTKTQKGMDFVAKAGGAVSAIFNEMINVGIKLTSAFIDLFTKPTEAIQKFKDILRDTPSAIANAAQAGYAMVEVSQQLREEERKLNVERANSRAEVERLKKISEDVSQSQEARLDAARKAGAIESNLLQQQIDLQKRKIDNIKAENALGQDTVEARDRLAEAEIQLAETQEESLGKQTELQNQLNQIAIEGIQARAKENLAATDADIRSLEEVGGAAIEYNQKLLELQKQRLRQQFELDAAGMPKDSKARLALETKLQSDIEKLRVDSVLTTAAVLDKVEQDNFEARLINEKQRTAAYFKLLKDRVDAQEAADIAAATHTLHTQEEVDAKLKLIEAKANADRKAIAKQQRQEELHAIDELLAARLAKVREGSKAEYEVQIDLQRKRLSDAIENEELTYEEFVRIQSEAFGEMDKLQKAFTQRKIEEVVNIFQQATSTLSAFVEASVTRQTAALDAQQAAVLSSAALSAEQRAKLEKDFSDKRAKIEKDAAEKRRKIASAENLINTALAVTKAFATGGPIVGIILAALALAKGIAQQAIIDGQKFQQGGPVFGPSHSQGGIPMYSKSGTYVGEMEGQEIILTKGVYQNPTLRAQASALNVLGGGKAFASPAMSTNLVDTSSIRRYDNGGPVMVGNDAQAIASAVLQGLRGANFRVGVDQVTRVQKDIINVEASADY